MPKSIAPLIVGYNHGKAVRLADVADVEDATSNVRSAGYLDGKPATLLIIFRQPGANIIETVDRIYAELPSVKASIPSGIETTVAIDRTTTIRASVRDVERTLSISVVLVVFVVFIFLRSGRATLIPSVAVPVSLIGTFAVMYLLGFSLDNLSLMALTISTGFVVDDAIVVMENISRHIEDGMSPMAATLQGAKEIGFTVFSISMSLIAVFIPILAMGGIVGRLFREFAITLSTAILVSMVISLTTTPMMCAYILKDEKTREAWPALSRERARFRRNAFALPPVAELGDRKSRPDAARAVLYGHPEFRIDRQNSQGILSDAGHRRRLRRSARPSGCIFPGHEQLGSATGERDHSTTPPRTTSSLSPAARARPTAGFMFMSLKPLNERDVTASGFLDRVRPKMNRLPVASAFLQAAQDIRIGGRGGNALYQYTIQSDTTTDLNKWGPILLQQMKKLPGFQDVNTDQQNGGLAELIDYDRVTAGRLGITSQALDSTLYSAFGQSQVSLIYTQLNQYYVVLEVAPPYWQDPSALNNIYMNTS